MTGSFFVELRYQAPEFFGYNSDLNFQQGNRQAG